MLLHGKNFNGFYWKDVIPYFTARGYRVVVPDQIGWGQSDKPTLSYSFHLLAEHTKRLLDSLRIGRVQLVGHSMGGMLATRFALLYPERVDRLVLENPIGLEDYKTFVPYRPIDSVIATERRSDYAALRKYQQSYYPQWEAGYEPYVAAQFFANQRPSPEQAALVSALTYAMIYEQPVVYEFKNLNVPTLLIIGQEDRTVVGKALLAPAVAAKRGQYPQLGRNTKSLIPGAQLVELPGVGHIPHIQVTGRFNEAVLKFLQTRKMGRT